MNYDKITNQIYEKKLRYTDGISQCSTYCLSTSRFIILSMINNCLTSSEISIPETNISSSAVERESCVQTGAVSETTVKLSLHDPTQIQRKDACFCALLWSKAVDECVYASLSVSLPQSLPTPPLIQPPLRFPLPLMLVEYIVISLSLKTEERGGGRECIGEEEGGSWVGGGGGYLPLWVGPVSTLQPSSDHLGCCVGVGGGGGGGGAL